MRDKTEIEAYELVPQVHLQTSLTYEGVGDMGPVDAALQFKLVVGLDIEKKMLVEANASHQVCPVGTFQGAPAVDMLESWKGRGVAKQQAQSSAPPSISFSSH